MQVPQHSKDENLLFTIKTGFGRSFQNHLLFLALIVDGKALKISRLPLLNNISVVRETRIGLQTHKLLSKSQFLNLLAIC